MMSICRQTISGTCEVHRVTSFFSPDDDFLLQFYILVEGHLMAERKSGGDSVGPPGVSTPSGPHLLESGIISPGAIISASAFLSRCK